MQKHVNLVDLVKSFPTNIFLQNLASIQKRTSPIKFDHLAEKSEKGSISNLSTKAGAVPIRHGVAVCSCDHGLDVRGALACRIKVRRAGDPSEPHHESPLRPSTATLDRPMRRATAPWANTVAYFGGFLTV